MDSESSQSIGNPPQLLTAGQDISPLHVTRLYLQITAPTPAWSSPTGSDNANGTLRTSTYYYAYYGEEDSVTASSVHRLPSAPC